MKNVSKQQKKPLASDFLEFLLVTGVCTVAISAAPYMMVAMIPAAHALQERDRKKKARNTFDNLRRRGFLKIESRRGKCHIELTERGKRHAYMKRLQQMHLRRTVRWDGTWRLLMYDIDSRERFKRDALRSLIKRIGFTYVQHSVWISPYDCRREVRELQQFFGLTDRECRLVETKTIGDDSYFRRIFKL